MFGKKSKKAIPEINGGTMADIAFLLLIFFMVTTTMDMETGIQRKLPEKVDQPEDIKVKERNVFTVLVNSNDQLLVNGELGDINLLKDRVKEFIANKNDDEHMPEKIEKEIELIGKYKVSKGVVSLQNDRLTSFEKYMQIQDVLTQAFNELRSELCQQKFNTSYFALQELAKTDPDAEAKIEALQLAIPLSISEAEPKKTFN